MREIVLASQIWSTRFNTYAPCAAARSRIEAQQHRSVITQLDSDLIVAAARVAPGRTVGEILSAVPSNADRVALEGHLLQMSR